jgi:hypothetical protein
MPLYDLDARHHARQHEEPFPDAAVIDRLWGLFVAICGRWGEAEDAAPMRSNFLVFIANRIKLDICYLHEYENAAAVLDELIAEHGQSKAHERLLTDPLANIAPPTTRLARARQRVSNEFISLQLALGGFKAFGAANYIGYIGGANIAGRVPYRAYAGDAAADGGDE